jgi:HK97 family phage portal protein
MKLFGLTIARTEKELSPVPTNRGGWYPFIREANTGYWQRNITIRHDTVVAFHAVFACQTLIASDISKLRMKLVAKDKNGIWAETASPSFSPVLRKPNGYQTRIQFFESWVLSKLQRGNAYILKQRDNRGLVIGLNVLDPCLVTPLVSDNGEVFYQLNSDHLAGLPSAVTVPAREIIHDRFNCLFHPLVGISPIFANGLAATQGLSIQQQSTRLFQNGAQPGGLLVAPGKIQQEDADRLKAYWDQNFTGENAGKVAVLSDGMQYHAMTQNARDAQVIDQLKWTAEVVCSTYHVPPYKIGVGAMPSYNNIQSLNVEYYSQCLQRLMEDIELCLDEGLGIGDGVTTNGQTYGTEFDVDGLLRMDSAAQIEVVAKMKGVATLDEQRRRIDLAPTEGGNTIYLQQQDHSLAAIAARDAVLVAEAENPTPPPVPANENEAEAREALATMRKGLA